MTHTELFGLPADGGLIRGDAHVTGQASGPVWPTACPPPARPLVRWELTDVAELPTVRAALRRHLHAAAPSAVRATTELRDQMILALDEMASNALRHGGGQVEASVHVTDDAYLIEVSDRAAAAPPTPAVDRDPSEGGLGLYLIAELASQHGWYARQGAKYVWALLPRS